MDLTKQSPAEGVMAIGHNMYRIFCSCGAQEHEATLEVTLDEDMPTITIYNDLSTPYWRALWDVTYSEPWALLCFKNLVNSLAEKLRLTKEVWFTGRVRVEGSVVLTPQSAKNLTGLLDKISTPQD